MNLRWTSPAAEDLYKITRYIRRDNPEAALDVARNIYSSCERLLNSPNIGRIGVETGTRELVLSLHYLTSLFIVSGN